MKTVLLGVLLAMLMAPLAGCVVYYPYPDHYGDRYSYRYPYPRYPYPYRYYGGYPYGPRHGD